MAITRLEKHKIISLKIYRDTSKKFTALRKELAVPSATDVIHLMVQRFPIPKPELEPGEKPKAKELPERKTVTKEFYEPDHHRLIRIKNGLNYSSYADVMETIVQHYMENTELFATLFEPVSLRLSLPRQPSVPRRPANSEEKAGEDLFANILAYLERKRKAKRKQRTTNE